MPARQLFCAQKRSLMWVTLGLTGFTLVLSFMFLQLAEADDKQPQLLDQGLADEVIFQQHGEMEATVEKVDDLQDFQVVNRRPVTPFEQHGPMISRKDLLIKELQCSTLRLNARLMEKEGKLELAADLNKRVAKCRDELAHMFEIYEKQDMRYQLDVLKSEIGQLRKEIKLLSKSVQDLDGAVE